MSDDKNLRDQFHILFDDFDDFEKTAEETAETAAEAAETVTETVGNTAEAVESAAEAVENAAETVESAAETAVETAADHIENAADTADSTVRQAAGLVDDTDIRNEKIYNEINFEDLSNVIGEQGEDEPAAITDAVKQATQTAVEAHSEIDHTFSDDLEDFDGLDELDDDFAALSKSLEESFEDSDVSEEMIPAIETASTAAVLSQDEDTDLVFEELSDEDEDEDDDEDDDE
ncbi:MAG: hypothetical protein IKI54_05600, partial [Lachnospiraceae bacterium]|nr:hypothetical protein [Lachnospiraceae bacterium]